LSYGDKSKLLGFCRPSTQNIECSARACLRQPPKANRWLKQAHLINCFAFYELPIFFTTFHLRLEG